MEYGKKQRSSARHTIFMALMMETRRDYAPDTVPHDMCMMVRKDAEAITDMVEVEYMSKNGAGGMWLARQCKDLDWLARIQEDVWKLQRKQERSEDEV